MEPGSNAAKKSLECWNNPLETTPKDATDPFRSNSFVTDQINDTPD